MNSILQESLSPTQQRGEFRPDAGRKLYETISNKDGDYFNVIIDYWMTDLNTFDRKYQVMGNHGIPKKILDEIIDELIQKEIK